MPINVSVYEEIPEQNGVPRVLYIPVVSGDEVVCVLNSLFVVVLAVNELVSVAL